MTTIKIYDHDSVPISIPKQATSSHTNMAAVHSPSPDTSLVLLLGLLSGVPVLACLACITCGWGPSFSLPMGRGPGDRGVVDAQAATLMTTGDTQNNS